MWKCHCKYTVVDCTEQHLVPKTFRFKSLLQHDLEYRLELLFSTESRSVLAAKLLFLLERQNVLRYTKIYSLVFQAEMGGCPWRGQLLSSSPNRFPVQSILTWLLQSPRCPLCNPGQGEAGHSAMSWWSYAPVWQGTSDRRLRSVEICSQA